MITPGAPVRLHRIRNDQLYHYYLGDPIDVLMLHVDGTTERVVVGPDLRGGQRVQLLIPGGTFHTARVFGRGRWFLGASTEWPGVERLTSRSAMPMRCRQNIHRSLGISVLFLRRFRRDAACRVPIRDDTAVVPPCVPISGTARKSFVHV